MAASISVAELERLVRRINALDAASRNLRVWLYIWTFAVAAGLIIEYWGEFIHIAQLLWAYTFGRVPFEWWRLRKAIAVVIGGILVTVGVLGELKIEFSQSAVDTELAEDNGRLTGELGAIAANALHDADDAMTKSGIALNSAEDAENKSETAGKRAGKAEVSSSSALSMATAARQEADRFETRLGSAETKANEADSQVNLAQRQAESAVAELIRIRTPRSLNNTGQISEALKEFEGTEYTFSAVFQNQESINFLKAIDSVLRSAGWKRTKPPSNGLSVILNLDKDLEVSPGSSTGIEISVDSLQAVAILQSRPRQKLPDLVLAAVTLNDQLFQHTSPQEQMTEPKVVVLPGKSPVLRITVGQKP